MLVLEPRQRRLTADDETIDNVCLAFADIIDAKSPFTYQHSNGVAGAALEIASRMRVDLEFWMSSGRNEGSGSLTQAIQQMTVINPARMLDVTEESAAPPAYAETARHQRS